jgi:cation diffusion facilitator family transporter
MHPPDPKEELYREALAAAWLGLGVNLALGAVKLAGGIVGHSLALVSDAVNSLGDSLASIFVLVALSVARAPADPEHPYGHTRAEAIAGSNVALVIILSALWMGYETLRQFQTHVEVPPWWTLAIAAANVAIKEVLYRYKLAVGERLGSAALIANAWDHRSDALCSLAVLAGLAAVYFGGAGMAWADPAASLAVVAAILYSGGKLFSASGHELMDAQADGAIVDQVRAAALRVEGVRDVEKLFVRKSGLEYLADIHVEVDSRLTVAAGHDIGHAVKDRLLTEFPVLRDVLVHLEPHPHEHGAGRAS